MNGVKTYQTISVFLLSVLLYTPCAADDDEIIVTATRRAIKTKNYAGSVFALGKQQLQMILPVHPAEALNEISGVNIHRNSGQEHLTAIRSPVLTGGAGAGSFLYLEDGVPLRAAGFANVNGLFEGAFELAGGVEVTKGPGSVLYGSNAVHGLINILSQPPSKARDFSFNVLGNNDGIVRLTASVSDKASFGRYRIAANAVHDNGFREASGYDQQKLQIRHDVDVGGWAVKTLATLQNLNQEIAGFIKGVDAYKDELLAQSNPNPEAFRDGKSTRIAVHLNKTTNENTRISLIPYARWIDLSFRRHFVPGKAIEDSGHKSIGLLVSYAGAAKFGTYTLGLDTEYTNGFLREFQSAQTVFSFIQGEHFDYKVKAAVLSPYVQVRFPLGPKSNINLGARADYTHYKYHNNIESGQFGRFIRALDRTDEYFTVSPKLGITHDFNENITLFGRIARGGRAPQITDAYSLQLGQMSGEVKPETLDAFELGLKGKLAILNLELAVFSMRKDKFFFRNADGFNVIDGITTHKGIEADFDVPLSDIFALSAGLTLARHTYEFTDIVGSASSSITKGNQVDTAPNTLGHVKIMAKLTDTFDAALKWQHVGEYYTDPGNTAKYSGHNIFTVRGDYKLSNQISLYGRVDNVLNTAYADRADFAFGDHRFFPGRPRTLFFGINYKD